MYSFSFVHFVLLPTSLSLIDLKRVLVQVLLPGPSDGPCVCLSVYLSVWWIMENDRLYLVDVVWDGGSAESKDEAGSWDW